MNQLAQVQQLLQSYQSQMDHLQRFISDFGKAPVQGNVQPDAVAAEQAAINAQQPAEAPQALTQQQSTLLLTLFKSFVADESKDGAKELTTGLMKFGRFAQSEFDKLRPKPES